MIAFDVAVALPALFVHVTRAEIEGVRGVSLSRGTLDVLLEMGFITNPEDERLLSDERQRRRMMRAVADGIDRYFREPSAPLVTASTGAAG